MTEQEQRIAIAEACGWVINRDEQGICRYWTSPNHGKLRFDAPPDYLHDLNAMNEAEKLHIMRGVGTALKYSKLLQECGVCFDFHATAAQRAEAFLRTLNLWKD